jgi:hypothetical protein
MMRLMEKYCKYSKKEMKERRGAGGVCKVEEHLSVVCGNIP